MYTFDEHELLRLAKIRAEPHFTLRGFPVEHGLSTSELNRAVAEARAEAVHKIFAGIGRLFDGIAGRFAARRRYQRAVGELQALDARTLHDIGITRADIPRVAAGLFVPHGREAAPVAPVLVGNQNTRKIAA